MSNETREDLIEESKRACGKFNAILIFNGEGGAYRAILDSIERSFVGCQTASWLWDAKSYEMMDVFALPSQDIEGEFVNHTGIFRKNSGEGEIILQYYDGKYFIENLFWFDDFDTNIGHYIIRDHFQGQPGCTLILGFELSIHITNIEQSLTKTINDTSLHPVLILEKSSNIQDYFIEDDERRKMLYGYLKKLRVE